MSQSKVSRIETGKVLPSLADVERILRALDVDRKTADQLLHLTRIANTEFRDIRASVRRGLHHLQGEIRSLETGASRVRFFLPSMITGLLQTPEYMRAAMSTPIMPRSGDVSRAMVIKLERQAVLHDPSKDFHFLITESALRWKLCPASVMALQVDRLASLSRLPTVSLGILPLAAHIADGPLNGFTLYDDRLVTVETFTGDIVLRDPKDIGYYADLFDFFADHAWHGDRARAFLAEVAHDFMQERD
jgi:hypothetical protein